MPNQRILQRKQNAEILFRNELLLNPHLRTSEIIGKIAIDLNYSKKTIYADLRPLKNLISDIKAGRYTLPENYESIM